MHRPIHAFRCLLLTAAGLLAAALPAARAGISRPEPEAGPTQVKLSAFVIDIDDVDSAEQNFTANVYFSARWRDPRLRDDTNESRIAPLDKVWHPLLLLVNQQRVWNSLPDVVHIDPDGNVTYRQRVWGQFSQPLDLEDFPFDRQDFTIQIADVANTTNDVQLIRNPDAPTGMSEHFSVADWNDFTFTAEAGSFQPAPGTDYLPGFLCTLTARRESGYYVAKVVVPLILIVAMSWVVFWIDPKESGTQIGVAMSAMLTLIAYRFAVGSNVPRVGYLTRMDAFILASTIMVFAGMVEVVITSFLARRGNLPIARWLDRVMRIVFPAVFAVFTARLLFVHPLLP